MTMVNQLETIILILLVILVLYLTKKESFSCCKYKHNFGPKWWYILGYPDSYGVPYVMSHKWANPPYVYRKNTS